MATESVPVVPPAIHRGDRYRLNFTAGAVLTLLDAYGSHPVSDIFAVLDKVNENAGIPGGHAGTQWTPPAAKPGRTYKDQGINYSNGTPRKYNKELKSRVDPDSGPNVDPDEDDVDLGEIEYYDDLVREFCTYFEADERRLQAIVQILAYAHLVETNGLDVSITDLGRGVVTAMREVEETARALGAKGSALTETQAYLVGDKRDQTGDHTVGFDVLPFSVTDALRIAASTDSTTHLDHPSVYADAIERGLTRPADTVDRYTGEVESDNVLPIRRSLHRHPTYRQFLSIVVNDRNTFVLAFAGVNPETTRIVGTKSDLGDARTVAADPDRQKIKRAREIAKQINKVAMLILSGGPDAVWTKGKLTPREIHADIVGFVAGGIAGFTDRTARDSSLAWETFDTLHLNMGDYELARSALHEGYGRGIVAKSLEAAVTVDPKKLAAEVIPTARSENKRITPNTAEQHVERSARKALIDMGIDVESMPVKANSANIQSIMCQHTSAFRTRGGEEIVRQCNGHAIGMTGFCEKHGGTYLDPDEMKHLILANQQKIVAATSMATEVMIELMLTSPNDAIRLRASEQLMNRGGLSESRDINVSIEHKVESPGAKLMKRISELSVGSSDDETAVDMHAMINARVIDGEIESAD